VGVFALTSSSSSSGVREAAEVLAVDSALMLSEPSERLPGLMLMLLLLL